MINREVHSWVESDTADNAVATATRAAPAGGLAHHVTAVSGSFSAANAGKTLILKQATTEIARWNVYDSFALVLPSPIRIEAGKAVSLELAASGGAGQIGAVTLSAYTL